MLLSCAMVYFRDTQFLWGILITIINFMTPIFYPESIIPAAFRTIYHLNPLYQIVYFIRCITLGGRVAPDQSAFRSPSYSRSSRSSSNVSMLVP